ncbi:MAG: pantothenate kinase, partial [Flavobacteriaceae bacterium]|nr:pantothenate kinase [Flavobacteriaceae bacterium]
YKELTVILTGGGAQYLLDSLKNGIFARSNFLLEGLNYLVQNNENKC